MPNPVENHDPWMNKDTPWRDEDTFRRLYFDESLTLKDIAEKLGCSTWTVNTWRDEYGLEKRREKFDEWKDADKLRRLYWDEGLSTSEIAERAGCAQPTVVRWMDEMDISARYTERKYGNLSTTEDGYVYYNGRNERVWVHQLVAVATGENPHDVFSDDRHCHHRNRVPWDNRPENVELLSAGEHTKEHSEDLEQALRDSGARVSASECGEIRARWEPNDNASDLADEFDISMATVWNHASGNCPHE